MSSKIKIIAFFLLLSIAFVVADENLGLSADDLQFDMTTNEAKAVGNVRITYKGIVLTANEASLNQETLDFIASGHVVIKTAGASWTSETPVKGNLKTQEYAFGPFRFEHDGWYVTATSGEYDKHGTLVLHKGSVTTCEKTKPHYHIGASTVKYNKDKTFSANHLTINFFNFPIFYFPYAWGKTDSMRHVIFKPSYSTKNGASLRLGYYWKTDDKRGRLRVYVDGMSKRGAGIGTDAYYNGEDFLFNGLAYAIHDRFTPYTNTFGPGKKYNRRFKTTKERGRVNFYYRQNIEDGLSMRVNYDLLSDIDMLENWYSHAYQEIHQPKSFIDLNYDSTYFSTGITFRPRINDFYSVVETMPEMRLSIPRIALGTKWLQYQSDTKGGFYAMRWRDFDVPRRIAVPARWYDPDIHKENHDYSTWRIHSQHFLYSPIDLGNLGILTPRVGFAFTAYSKTSKRKIAVNDIDGMLSADNPDWPRSTVAVQNYDSLGDGVARWALETGVELKNRFYSDWNDFSMPIMQVDGIRHILEPYINYTFMPTPSFSRSHLYFFDEIDRLEKQHFIRFGIDQRLQTRHNGLPYNLLRLESYYDQHFFRDDENNSYCGNLGNRLTFTPSNRLSFRAAMLYDVGSGRILRGESGVTIGKSDETNLSVSYNFKNDYLSRSVYSLGSTLVDITNESGYIQKYFGEAESLGATLRVPINSKTHFTGSWSYDFNKYKISSQRYQLHRRLHCWDLILGFRWSNNEFAGVIMLELTRFPSVKVDLNYR